VHADLLEAPPFSLRSIDHHHQQCAALAFAMPASLASANTVTGDPSSSSPRGSSTGIGGPAGTMSSVHIHNHSTSAPAPVPRKYTGKKLVVGFVGLGAMGFPIAAWLARAHDRVAKCYVFNRTLSVAEEHSRLHGSMAVESFTDLASPEPLVRPDVICTCLPTSNEVFDILRELAPLLPPGSTVLDFTSGNPSQVHVVLSCDSICFQYSGACTVCCEG